MSGLGTDGVEGVSGLSAKQLIQNRIRIPKEKS
jgi:hypothetical protein